MGITNLHSSRICAPAAAAPNRCFGPLGLVRAAPQSSLQSAADGFFLCVFDGVQCVTMRQSLCPGALSPLLNPRHVGYVLNSRKHSQTGRHTHTLDLRLVAAISFSETNISGNVCASGICLLLMSTSILVYICLLLHIARSLYLFVCARSHEDARGMHILALSGAVV